MALVELSRVHPAPEGVAPGADADGHPMRAVTRNIATVPGWWNAERAAEVGAFFDQAAVDWDDHDVPGRDLPLEDAIERGMVAAPPATRRVCLDVGAGIGLHRPVLAPAFDQLVLVDLAFEMLRRAPAGTPGRVQADASRLPVADASVDALVLVNCFLFPAEVERVLAARGVVVTVSSRGTATPIHLDGAEVVDALPGPWSGVTSAAGWGLWTVAWRGDA